MYAKYSNISDKRGRLLKQYHHINLDVEFKGDCTMWLRFLDHEDLAMVVSRPFIDLTQASLPQTITFYSDASAAEFLGYGVYFNEFWTFSQWEDGFIKQCNPSIAFLELYALVAGIFLWGEKIQNTRATIYCDNKSARDMVNSTVSRCPFCMKLIRRLIYRCLELNLRIFVKYVESENNEIADSLSRLEFKRFKKLTKDMKMNPLASPLPKDLQTPRYFYSNNVYF